MILEETDCYMISFQYQKYWLRWAMFIPYGILLIVLHGLLSRRFEVDAVYYGVGIVIMLIGIGVVFNLTEKMSFIVHMGTAESVDGKIILTMGRRTWEISKVTELFACDKRIGGSRFSLLLIKTDAGSIKIYSAPLKSGEEFENSDLMDVFLLIRSTFPDMEPVKDVFGKQTDYWYKKG